MSTADAFTASGHHPIEYGERVYGFDSTIPLLRNTAPLGASYADNQPSPEALRERAYRRARQELPDAPVEDVICRAQRIAIYLKGETAPKKPSE